MVYPPGHISCCDLSEHRRCGRQLRNEDSQAALAELSASPVVHLAASIDHVNAPLMWDVGLAGKFNWVSRVGIMRYKYEASAVLSEGDLMCYSYWCQMKIKLIPDWCMAGNNCYVQ